MAQALKLARRGWYSTPPNPRVGCVLVRNGQVIGEGWHAQTGGSHAEVAALQDAQTRGGDVKGATAYVTLEPCCHQGRTPACTQALINAGIVRVVVGMQDPNPQVAGKGVAALTAAGVSVKTDVLQADCVALNPGFIMRMRQGRPRFRLKMAMSLDGRTAAANGESQWITGPQAREDVQKLRAESGAVLTGMGTALADDPSLNVRLPGDWRQPLRVVLDSQLRLSESAKMLKLDGQVIILTASENRERHAALSAQGAQVQHVAACGNHLDLHAAARCLAQYEINDVLVECGATLAGALLQTGLVDEFLLYVAPSLIGSAGRGLLDLPGLNALQDKMALDITDIRAIGQDWRITARPQACKAI